MRTSGEPAADELPRQVVAWVDRTIGPGSRIQVARRLPLSGWHLAQITGALREVREGFASDVLNGLRPVMRANGHLSEPA